MSEYSMDEAIDDVLDELDAVRQAGSADGPVRERVPSDLDRAVPYTQGDRPVPDTDRPFLELGPHPYQVDVPLNFEGSQYRGDQSGILYGIEDDRYVIMLDGAVEAHSIRAPGEELDEWPQTRVPQGMFDAAFNDGLERVGRSSQDEDVIEEKRDEVRDSYARISDIVLADRLDPSDDTFILRAKEMEVPQNHYATIVQNMLESRDHEITTYGTDEEGYFIGDAMDVTEDDFYIMDDGTVMQRFPDGRFGYKIEEDHHPVMRYIENDPGVDADDDIRLYPTWTPERAGEDVKNAHPFREAPGKRILSALSSDINTPYRDIQAGIPEGESTSATFPIEFANGDGEISNDPADWMFIDVMSSNYHGARYPVITVPNAGDVDRKLAVARDVLHGWNELADVGSANWREVNRFLPHAWEQSFEDIEDEAAFIDSVVETGEVTANEYRDVDWSDDPETFISRGYSDITLSVDGKELTLHYGDGSLHGSDTPEPSRRFESSGFFNLLAWFDEQGVDIDYSREHSSDYQELLSEEIYQDTLRAMDELAAFGPHSYEIAEADSLDFEALRDWADQPADDQVILEFGRPGQKQTEETIEEIPDEVVQLGEAFKNAQETASMVKAVETQQELYDMVFDVTAMGVDETQPADHFVLHAMYDRLDDLEDELRQVPAEHRSEHSPLYNAIESVTYLVSNTQQELFGEHPDQPVGTMNPVNA